MGEQEQDYNTEVETELMSEKSWENSNLTLAFQCLLIDILVGVLKIIAFQTIVNEFGRR